MNQAQYNQLFSFIWNIANDVLVQVFTKGDYKKIILPMMVLRPDECPSKFQVMPKQWIVERSFAWLENFRRLTIDYEFHAETAVTMIQLAFCFHDT